MAIYACVHCLEDVREDEPYCEINDGASRVHPECMLRMVAGTIAHQERRCSCYGGTDDGDPPGMTGREAALQAAHFCANGKRP
jgi:hypothetical protein